MNATPEPSPLAPEDAARVATLQLLGPAALTGPREPLACHGCQGAFRVRADAGDGVHLECEVHDDDCPTWRGVRS